MKRNQQVRVLQGPNAGKTGKVISPAYGPRSRFISVLLSDNSVVMTDINNLAPARVKAAKASPQKRGIWSKRIFATNPV